MLLSTAVRDQQRDPGGDCPEKEVRATPFRREEHRGADRDRGDGEPQHRRQIRTRAKVLCSESAPSPPPDYRARGAQDLEGHPYVEADPHQRRGEERVTGGKVR